MENLSVSRLSIPLRDGAPVVLGKGAFGHVVLAVLDGACPVAVKVLPRDARRVARRQILREYRRYQSLAAVPGVARCYGSANADGFLLLVTEHLRGGSLRNVLRTGGVDVRGGLRVGHVVANALAAIHARGFSHGDIKPGNVLFAEKVTGMLREGIEVRLVDFGLSRKLTKDDDDDDEEKDGEEGDEDDREEGERRDSLLGGDARGTPAYLSPEAWEGKGALKDRHIAEKADVYALGMLLYEVESGKIPWADCSEWDIFCAVVNVAERPAWGDTVERVDGYRSLVERCWAQKPVDRPTALEVADELAKMRAALGYGTEMGEMQPSPVIMSPRIEETRPLVDYIEELEPLNTANRDTSNTTHTNNGNFVQGDQTENSVVERLQIPSVRVVTRSAGALSSVPSSRSRDVSAGYSVEDGSTNGGYDPDGSNTNLRNSDLTFRSLGSSDGAVNGNEGSTVNHVAEPIVVPETVHNLQYAFKAEVERNDMDSLCKVLHDSERNPVESSRALEAIGVLLARDEHNCVQFVECGGMHLLTCVLSRYGGSDARLSKAACVVVANLGLNTQNYIVERELRKTGACQIVLSAIRSHPSKMPVMQNAAHAVVILCRASPTLRSIVLDLDGISHALRVVARGVNSFRNDVLVASDGLEILSILAESHTEQVAQAKVISEVLKACNSYKERKTDDQCLNILRLVTRHAKGQEILLSTRGSMGILSGLIERLLDAGSQQAKLRDICYMMSILAQFPRRDLARDAFLSSHIVDLIVQAVKSNTDPGPGSERSVINADSVAMAIAGLQCFTSMTRLGQDVCGSMQIAQVFLATKGVLRLYPTNRNVALKAVMFLENILKELRSSSVGAPMEIVLEMLVQLRQRWQGDQTIVHHSNEARKILQSPNRGEENPWEGTPNDAFESYDSHLSSPLKIFSRLKSGRSR